MQKQVRATPRARDVGRLGRVRVHDAQTLAGFRLVVNEHQGILSTNAHVEARGANDRAQGFAVPHERARKEAVLNFASRVEREVAPLAVGDEHVVARLERD